MLNHLCTTIHHKKIRESQPEKFHHPQAAKSSAFLYWLVCEPSPETHPSHPSISSSALGKLAGFLPGLVNTYKKRTKKRSSISKSWVCKTQNFDWAMASSSLSMYVDPRPGNHPWRSTHHGVPPAQHLIQGDGCALVQSNPVHRGSHQVRHPAVW